MKSQNIATFRWGELSITFRDGVENVKKNRVAKQLAKQAAKSMESQLHNK